MSTEPISVDRGQRVDRYQEIAGILWDERLYELLTPGGFDRLFVGPKPSGRPSAAEKDPVEVRVRRKTQPSLHVVGVHTGLHTMFDRRAHAGLPEARPDPAARD